MPRSGVVSVPSIALADRVAARLSRQRPWIQSQSNSRHLPTKQTATHSTRQRPSTCIPDRPALNPSSSSSIADRVTDRLSRQPWAKSQLNSRRLPTQQTATHSTRQRPSTCIRDRPALNSSSSSIADRVTDRLSRQPWAKSQLNSRHLPTQQTATYSTRESSSTCTGDRPALNSPSSSYSSVADRVAAPCVTSQLNSRHLPKQQTATHLIRDRSSTCIQNQPAMIPGIAVVETRPLGSWITAPRTKIRFVSNDDLASTSTGGLSSLDTSDTGSSALSSASTSATVIVAEGTKAQIVDLVQDQQVTDSAPSPAETVSVAKGKRADRRVKFAEDESGVIRPAVREIVGLGQHRSLVQHIWWSKEELEEIWQDKFSSKVHFADDPVTEVITYERWIDSVEVVHEEWEKVKEGGFFDRFSGKLRGWSRVNDEDHAFIRSFGSQPILHDVSTTMSKFQYRHIDPIPFCRDARLNLPVPMAILPEEFGANHFTIHGMKVPLVFASGMDAEDIPPCIRTAGGMEMYLEMGIPNILGSLHPQGFIRAGKWFSGHPRTFKS